MFCREFVASQIRGSLSLDHSTPFRVDCVGVSAQEALDHLLNSSFEYNLVLMDMSMPGAPDRNRAGPPPPPLQYVCTTRYFVFFLWY
jgi:CheY-like chemotaxis protein